MTHVYSEGVCEGGAAILRDGEPMRVHEIVAGLNSITDQVRADEELKAAYLAGVAAARRNADGGWMVEPEVWLDRYKARVCVSCGDVIPAPGREADYHSAWICYDCEEICA